MKRKLSLEDDDETTGTKRMNTTCEINDLPPEVLILIFEFFTPSERRNVLTVCHYWLNTINNFFRSDHCLILTGKIDYSPSGSLYQTFEKRLNTTKHLRSFYRLIIDSTTEFEKIMKFLDLIADEIEDLRIVKMTSNDGYIEFFKSFFNKFPKMKTLDFIGLVMNFHENLTSDGRKTFNLSADYFHFNDLINFINIETFKINTVSSLRIFKKDLEREDATSIIELDTVKLLVKEFFSEESTNESITLQTKFNFRGEKKMSLDDVEGIKVDQCVIYLSPNTFDPFKNLKELSLFFCDPQKVFISIAERAKYSGITHLTFEGAGEVTSNFIVLLQSFPDLEYLNFDNIFILDDQHLSTICEYMPKLKTFVWPAIFSEITINGLLAEDRYSLKDLKFLERLDIKTCDETNEFVDMTHLQWPPLPHLKQLSLTGQSLREMNQDFYAQLAENSPKITHLTIDNAYIQDDEFEKFIPMWRHLKLTHLTVIGETYRGHYYNEPNGGLVETLVPHCDTLQFLYMEDKIQFSLSEELLLFKSLRSLKKIVYLEHITNFKKEEWRKMTRKDIENLKSYLKQNLHTYNINKTIDYIINNVLSRAEYEKLHEAFISKFGNQIDDSQKKLHIVTCGFLEMGTIDLCHILNISLSEDY